MQAVRLAQQPLRCFYQVLTRIGARSQEVIKIPCFRLAPVSNDCLNFN
jgi:hypothetical protein